MRRVHYADVAAAARAVQNVDPACRATFCLRLIREAQTAEAHRRETGRPHPLWGSGALMETARRHPLAPERGFENAEFCQALRLVLDVLLDTAVIPTRN